MDELNFYYSDESYKIDYLTSHYFKVLNILVKILRETGVDTDNKTLHELNKENFGKPISLKDLKDLPLLMEFLKATDEYWNKIQNITFMP